MKLINNLSMRGKLVTLVVPALLVILFFATGSIVLSYGKLGDMRELGEMVELAQAGDPVTEALQKERGRSAVFIASKPGSDAARQAERDLRDQRNETDNLISAYISEIEVLMADTEFDQSVEASIRSVRQRLGDLDTLRNLVDNRSDAAPRYTAIIMELIDRIGLIVRRSTDPELTREVNGYHALAKVAEMAGRERAAGASMIRSGDFDLPTVARIAGLGGQQEAFLNEAIAMLAADNEIRAILESQSSSVASQALAQRRETLFSSPSGMYALDASDWFTTTTQRISNLNQARRELLSDVMSLASKGVIDARNDLMLASGISAGAIIAVLVLMLVIIRAINLQVGRLLDGVRFAMDNKDLTREIEISSRDCVFRRT
ncbi:nitrate- and nitrite sensing domain-containing protein [Marinobacter adhaerens]|uniref:nitrate- and nitrite sensing domain-containing protein n=1 Tax=Marinobacter adhaerens TaxID=1033846 RepID=UPI001D0D53CE|nr:nitrate- and nitrite sensing domain-containing protein [Marinobacter adhaerens]